MCKTFEEDGLQRAIEDFERLARVYGLPDEDEQERGKKILLQIRFVGRRKVQYISQCGGDVRHFTDGLPHSGLYYTQEEIQGDFSALEIAKMLRQLRLSQKGFSLLSDGLTKDYSPICREILKQSLVLELSKRVEKGKSYLVLSKGSGGSGDAGRAFLVPYPASGAEPQQEGFTDAELKAIITYEEKAQEEWNRTQGRKYKDKMNQEAPKTRLPELGRLAGELKHHLPDGWGEMDKNCFVADFMYLAGFLDFKGDAWMMDYECWDRKKKYDNVCNWIKSSKIGRK